jgi:hypothetical protein
MTVTAARTKVPRTFLWVALATALGMAGCAASSGTMQGGAARIPAGLGRLVLETGGCGQVNFYVLNLATEAEVYSETPRQPGSSPAGYERGGQTVPQMCDLPPGHYSVVVNTDVNDPVQISDVEVVVGETRYASVPVGRFQLMYYDQTGTRGQVPFLIYDYGLNAVLGRGMTSTEAKYFIVPAGNYKVRLENTPSGMDEIRPVQVSFGGTQNISIGSATVTPTEQQGSGTPTPTPNDQ